MSGHGQARGWKASLRLGRCRRSKVTYHGVTRWVESYSLVFKSRTRDGVGREYYRRRGLGYAPALPAKATRMPCTAYVAAAPSAGSNRRPG